MERIYYGVAGAGNIACNAHLPAYLKQDVAKVSAICDLNLERAKAAAEKFGVEKYFSSVTEMLDSCPEIECVDICTWNNAHCDVAVEAANRKKHVMCEKPMARSLDDALKMQQAVEKSGVKFMLAVPNRFKTANYRARALVDSGALGDIYYAKTAYIRRRGTPSGWFTDKKTSGGGPVIDIGVHRIDTAWYLMGCPKPVSVSAAVSFNIGDYATKGVSRWEGTPCPDNRFDVEDMGAGSIRFENGAILLFEASWAINAPDHGDTLVCGSKGGLVVDPMTFYGEKDGYLHTEVLNYEVADESATLNEILAFNDTVRGVCPSRFPVEQAVTLQRMLEGIYRSAECGKEVAI